MVRKLMFMTPWVDKAEAKHEYNISPIEAPQENTYDTIIIAVSHNEFAELGAEKIHSYGKSSHVLYDIKYLLDASDVDGRL